MAEFMFKQMIQQAGLADKFEIASAATSSEEIFNGRGNPVYPAAKEMLNAHGISCAGKRAVQLKHSDYDYYDYLIAMDEYNIRNMRKITGGDPQNKIFKLLDLSDKPRDIADPWYSGDFQTCWSDLEEGLELLLKKLESESKR